MLILNIVESLRFMLSSTPAANEIPFTVSYTLNGKTLSNSGTSDGGKYATIIESTNAAQQELTYLSISNTDSASQIVTLEIFNIQTNTIVWRRQFVIDSSDMIQYIVQSGFNVIDSTGKIKVSGETGLNKEVTQQDVKIDLSTKLSLVASNLVTFNLDSNTRLDLVASKLVIFNTDSNTRLDTVAANLVIFNAASNARLDSIIANTTIPVPLRFANYGANVTLNVSAVPAKVYSVSCINDNNANRYIQLHNTATVPIAGAVPLYTFLVIGKTTQTVVGTEFFTIKGATFSTGIAFAFSTTRNTYTAGAAADQSTIIMYSL